MAERAAATAAPKPENDAFTAFIANAKNAFPLAAAKEIAEQRADVAYNPFLLCGRSGTGKSHILRSMAATLKQGQTGNRVILASAARFCADNPAWVRHPELFWQQCDVLLLDDIQDIAGQNAWQQKLVSCIDACPSAASPSTGARRGGQMVFACTGQPQALKALDERLRSRLESGLVVELMEPDLDVRMRYLQAMCKERNMSLSRDQLLFIAQRCSQFRLLQGLLLKVAAFCSVTGCELSQADLENIVRTGVADKTPGCLEILGEVARAMNLRPEDVLGGKRRPDLVLARQVSMYICRRKLGLSYPELGRAFGGKDHSTVIHAIKKIKKNLVSDKALQQMVTELELKTQ
jgi:chromosomal replication initiator protein